MHHTIDKIPNQPEEKKFAWQKEHKENKTGTPEKYVPVKINKNGIKKNMRLGSKIKFLSILTVLFYHFSLNAENKITSTPLINLNEIKPSFEDVEEKNEIFNEGDILKQKKNKKLKKSNHAILIGLDKITAKSTEIRININEAKKYGPLEIKILKCGQVKVK